MTDDDKPITSWLQAVDKAVLGVCELLGLLFALPFGEDLYHGTPITWWHWFWLWVGIICAATGPIWPYIRKKINEAVTQKLEATARNPLLWIGLLLIIFLYTTSDTFASRYGSFTFNSNPNFEMVKGKKFYNERVVLDGKKYEDCTFENVTFVYNGTTPVHFSHNRVMGRVLFASDNPSVNMSMVVFYGMGLIPSNVPILNLPDGNILTPPQRGAP